MSIKEVTCYYVQCDEPGCETKSGDVSDYSAFADPEMATDDWKDAEGVATRDRRQHFCYEHARDKICSGCDDYIGTVLIEIDDERWCRECFARETT